MFETILHAVTCTRSVLFLFCLGIRLCPIKILNMAVSHLYITHSWFILILWWKIEISFTLTCVITRTFYLEHIKCIHWLFINDVIVKMTL